MKEYRLSWKREGSKPRHKLYARLRNAQTFAVLLGPEPWKYYGGTEADLARDERVSHMTKVEWVKIEEREVGPWSPISDKEKA